MTRLGQAGFETGDTLSYGADALYGGTTQSRLSLATGTPTPRTGTYCLKCDYGAASTGSSGSNFGKYKRFGHASKSDMWYSFGAYLHQGNEGVVAPGVTLWRNIDAAGRQNAALHWDGTTLRATYTNTSATNPSQPSISGAEVTTIGSAGSVSGDAWHLIEIHYVGSTTTTGTLEVWVDGVQTLNATGTRTSHTNAAVTEFDLGCLRQNVSGMINGTCTNYFGFDDVRWQDTTGSVNNGRPGDEAIRLMVPTSAGDSAQFTRGGTDSGANYTQMDEIPPNSGTDYVYSTTVGHLDLYNTTDFPVTAISAVNVLAQVANSDGGGGSIYLPTKTGAGQSDGTAVTLTGTWNYQSRLLESDPADSAAWSSAKLAALQIGLKVAS